MLVYYMETSYHVNSDRQSVAVGHGEQRHTRGGLLPTPVFERSTRAYPMLRYPWADARAALGSLAADQPELHAVQMTYVNPQTGGHVENILGFYAMMLRPGQTLVLPARSPAMVFHLIEGGATVRVEEQCFALQEADTCCAPGYTPVTLANSSATVPAFLFIADETPLHQKLGVYETRA